MKLNITQHHGSFQFDLPSYPLEESDAILLWADWPYPEVVKQVKQAGKKVICYEHGRNALWDYYLNDRPMLADAYLAWGQSGKDAIEEAGIAQGIKKPVYIIGNPVFNKLRRRKENRVDLGYLNILFVPMHWVRGVEEFNSRYLKMLLACLNESDKVTVKTMEKTGIVVESGKGIDSIWWTDVEQPESMKNIVRRIKEFDVVVTPKESTFELAARFAGIPVIELDVEKEYRQDGEPTNYQRVWGDKCSPQDLQEYIYKAREDTLYTPTIQEIEYECMRPSIHKDKLLEIIENV